jgi:pimeloyl-ACP methyl ester carboxylesterase
VPFYTGADGALLPYEDSRPGSGGPVIALDDVGDRPVRVVRPRLRAAEDVEALRGRLDLERVVLLADGDGTGLARDYAARFPERVGALLIGRPDDRVLERAVTREWYWDFGVRQARGESPTYERLSAAVAGDDEILDLLTGLPEPKRQPNLLYGVVRLLGGPVADPAAFHDFVVTRWPEIAAQMRVRATQTNETGRCALLLPVLAALPQPIALIEVGASAGLNLYPDRYAYRYGGHTVGAGSPVLDCDLTGVTPPDTLPEVVWRAGLDRNPLDVTDDGDMAWLDALIWPEHEHRRDRFRAAVAVARADPPRLVRGDLLDTLPGLVAEAPAGATVVVFHSAVLYQVPPPARDRFLALVRSLPVRWISIEAPAVVPVGDLPPGPGDLAHNVLALDGTPLAWTHGHGRSMTWFGPTPAALLPDSA